MSLRSRALALILIAGALGILGQWSAVPGLARGWCIPVGLLLLGLAWEGAVSRRRGLELAASAPAHWPLARTRSVGFEFRQSAARALVIQAALTAPEEVRV